MSQHTAFYCYLKDHLKAYPEEYPLYMEVEKVRVSFQANLGAQAKTVGSALGPRVLLRGVLS